MKKLIRENFYVPKHGKVAEKVVLNRITAYIICILACLMAMSFTAYAFFTHSVSSSLNTIVCAKYELTVTPVTEVEGEGLSYVLKNDTAEAKEFVFSISKSVNSTASVGYCKIEIKTDVNDVTNPEDVQRFYTQPIWTDIAGDPTRVDTRAVTIVVEPNKTATVVFIAEWGTYVGEVIGEKIDTIKYGESIVQNEIPVEQAEQNTTDEDETDTTSQLPEEEPAETESQESHPASENVPQEESESETSSEEVTEENSSKEETQSVISESETSSEEVTEENSSIEETESEVSSEEATEEKPADEEETKDTDKETEQET